MWLSREVAVNALKSLWFLLVDRESPEPDLMAQTFQVPWRVVSVCGSGL